MGNKKQAVETKKRKKKGRPSLLELQKRSLRLQKQEEKQQKLSNPKPNPNPYLKFPTRLGTRRNPNPNLDEEDEDEEEEEDDSNAKRKEKKLKLVLRIPNGSELGGSGSESEGSRKKRKIGDVETARQNSNSKATEEAAQGDPLDSGPTTPLPDKKLLVFILDRLQKKDTYGVFSEPVDPEELPDYHEIIEHPMDFGTIRKKLESGAYENLEQFESDVFLISSNAMRYNASDTIYFRQARSIQEIAKKDFENLRQESDDNEEPKTVRRGRPPIKNIMKRIGRPPADRIGSDFSSDATLANARDGIHSSNLTRDLSRKGSSLDKSSTVDAHRGNGQHRLERNEEYSGSPLKGIPMRTWKKFSIIDENRRNTYSQPLQSICAQEPSILTAFEGEKKFLMPVGLYMEHAYARSLARFAANLGPVGWEIAAKRIEKVLPPGTKFGRGWVGDSEPAKVQFRPPPQVSPSSSTSSSPHSAQAKPLGKHELASNNSTSSTTTSKPVGAMDGAENGRILSGGGMHRKSPLQLCQNSPMQLPVNGFNPGYGFRHPSQAVKMNPNVRLPDVGMTHGHVLDMVSRSNENHQAPFARHVVAEQKARSVVGNLDPTNPGQLVPDSNCNSETGDWWSTSAKQNHGSIPPDLKVDFHSPASLISGALADSKQPQQEQPELALQL